MRGSFFHYPRDSDQETCQPAVATKHRAPPSDDASSQGEEDDTEAPPQKHPLSRKAARQKSRNVVSCPFHSSAQIKIGPSGLQNLLVQLDRLEKENVKIADLEERTLALERNNVSYREDIEELNDLCQEQNRNITTLKEIHDDLLLKAKAYRAESQELIDRIRREIDGRPGPVRDGTDVSMEGDDSARAGAGLGQRDIITPESGGQLGDVSVGAQLDPPVGLQSEDADIS